MNILNMTLLSTDITILGHFNPAILRHDFLTQICKFDFGSPLNSSPPDILVVSEIQYDKIRWFMDFDRMTVQNLQLQSPSDFTAPKFAEKYLKELPHTPIFAAGLNLLADFEFAGVAPLWENLLYPDRIYVTINRFGGESAQTISRMGLSESGGELLEATIIYNMKPEGRVQLAITRSDEKRLRCSLNWETRGMEDRNKLSPFVNQADSVMTSFSELISALAERI